MAAPSPTSAASPLQAEVDRVRALMERGDFAGALVAATAGLARAPTNRELMYARAVSERYLGRIPAALAALQELERAHPGYSRLYQEQGQCYVAQRAAEPAIQAFLRAVNLNPALPASWNALQGLYRLVGQHGNAQTAANHVATLARLAPEVVTATSLFSDGDLEDAERIIRAYLLQHPHDIEGMRLLARIGVRLEILDDAEFLLANVLKLDPEYHLARYEYASVLSKRHCNTEAMRELEKLLKRDPNDRAYRTLYAAICVGLGRHEEAIRIYRELLPQAREPAELHLSIAHALKTLGRQAEAINSYHAAMNARPSFGDAFWSLANLKTYRFTDGEIAHMRAQEEAPATSLDDRCHLDFALGKAFEDRGRFEESFGWYARGNEVRRRNSRYQAGVFERAFERQAALCDREFFAARAGFGCAALDPIFIVGLPRAGSTLIEQILASHSAVEGTMELPDVPRLVHQLQGREHSDAQPRYPAVLAELTAAQCTPLGEQYLQSTRVYRSGKPYFIDKNPNNFRHVALIHLMLPNARIIDARREPMACCFSNFKQLFATGQEFTYSLEDIARYYRAYIRLMAHWDAVLPGRVLRVQHEALLSDFEPQVRRILDFVGLKFEPACLEFYKTERSVRTASSEQVRQPLFKEGIDQWRNFEPWLGTLRSALGELAPG